MAVGVIGGGPAGAAAAYELARQGVEVDLYEAGGAMGGLARSLSLWNQTVDLGPHRFFSRDRRVNQLWLDVVGKDYVMVKRSTRIYYNGKFFHYPLRPVNAFTQLGPFEAAHCAVSYLKERALRNHRGSYDTFEDWVISRFGKRLYDIFFKTYSEKLWGISCRDLDSDFAAQRIRRLSLGEAVLSTLLPRKGLRKHRTLVDEFAYPLFGTGMVYRRMAERIREFGGRVYLNTPVQRVLACEGRASALELPDGTVREYSEIVSSMPISLLVSRLPEAPESIRQAVMSLQFRNTILVYLKVEGVDIFPDQWLYIHSKDLLMGRITNFRNWVPTLYGDEHSTILALEYWANEEDPLWHEAPDRLIRLGESELRKTKLIGDLEVSDGFVQKIHRCYPIYRAGYKRLLKPVEEYLRSVKGLQAIGRYGAFKYNNQDHSLLMGILAAENIVHGANHNLWEINTDYDDYQETTLITEGGLLNQHSSPIR